MEEELGSEEHEWHAAIVRYACTLDLDLLVLVGSRMAHASSNCTGPNVWSAEQGEDLVDPLNEWLDAGDRILFKGSRGARVERMLQRLKEKRLTAEGSSRCSIT